MKRNFYVTFVLLAGLLSAYAVINVYASAPASFIGNPFLSAEWTGYGSSSGELFGSGVAAAGDVNGDGFADIIVGAPNYTNDQINEGRAYAYYGSASGLPASPDWTFESDTAGCKIGLNVATAGDVNNDGYDDVMIASEFCTPTPGGITREGRVYLFLGSASGLSTTYDWMAQGEDYDESFGWSIASAGDINGDGFDDVVIGAPWADYGPVNDNVGRVYIYYGSTTGLPLTPSLFIDGNPSKPWTDFGVSVDSAGDVEGDGYDDVIIGWSGYAEIITPTGMAHIYSGSAAGLVITPTWSFSDTIMNGHLGGTVAGVGDVNGDEFDDVMVAESTYVYPNLFAGNVYLFLGSATGPSTSPDWQREPDQSGDMAWDIQSAGDVNADGFGDVLIGSPFYDRNLVDEGIGFLYFGSATGLLPEPVYSILGGAEYTLLGWSLDTAGDVNGDGIDDLIVGAMHFNTGYSDPGKADVFYGRIDAAYRSLLPVIVR